ncbi:toprim domain-containing protein [Sphingobacterium siyangense]|uniref:toprim domain-containing protein n=1 Tax=Sphingobacterium siyangense TaxID=459529 RepID=UPI002FDE5313
MGSSNTNLSCSQVNDLDIVTYLQTLGYQPNKIVGQNYWYLSPLRIEHTASFKVNRFLNRWYDFGIGKGGKLVDFGILYFNCTIRSFLASFRGAVLAPHVAETFSAKSDPQIKVTATSRLHAFALIRYLDERGITFDLAAKYCQQVHFSLNGKTYFGIGFPNDKGGYEIRNPYFKSCASPKAVTTYKNGYGALSVFEGFIDFLSFLQLFAGTVAIETDWLILNSLSFFEQQMDFMLSYNKIFLYLDNDKAGKQCAALGFKTSAAFVAKDSLYIGYKDLNDLLTGVSLPPTTDQTP